MTYKILQGDARHLPFDGETFDSCVTDPPYELGFMGKDWDRSGVAYDPATWREVFRVLKPGAHLLAFGGTRTYHRMAVAIEDAGFEIRDQLQWLYGSGFPKSHDISKAIDKMNGAEREVVGKTTHPDGKPRNVVSRPTGVHDGGHSVNGVGLPITLPTTDEAKQWNGWGTALKPANEPICLARKPLEKGLTVAQNILKYGTGALNIDACRIPTDGRPLRVIDPKDTANNVYAGRMNGSLEGGSRADGETNLGRWPANVIHDGSEEVLEQFPEQTSGANPTRRGADTSRNTYSEFAGQDECDAPRGSETGSAARFFYCAKAAQSERNRNGKNNHPTVKPISLMAYLCRLITPPKGMILDPFNGSGSTGLAAVQEGFQYVGIELDADYIEISKRRFQNLQVGLFV